MTEKKIAADGLSKALEALQGLAKGHASGSAPSTKVPAVAGESGATQVFHTAANSNPDSWAGSKEEKDQKWDDSISENGTDYDGKAKMHKSIMDKLAKGQALTAEEFAFAKSMMAKSEDEEKKEKVEKAKKDEDEVEKAVDDKKEEEDEKEGKKMPPFMKKEVKKSLADYAQEDAKVREGLEVSEFLAGFAGVISKAMASQEARLAAKIDAAVGGASEESGTFSKSLAEAVSNLGDVLAVHAQRLEQIEASPARGPKSTLVAKSIPGTGGEEMTKSTMLSTMVELVQKGQLDQRELLKFDATGELSPETNNKVRSYRSR